MLDPFHKQPNEEITILFNWESLLYSVVTTGSEALSIASASITATNSRTGIDASSVILTGEVQQFGNKIYQKICGGVDKTSYQVTCRITLNDGQVFEEDLPVIVKEE